MNFFPDGGWGVMEGQIAENLITSLSLHQFFLFNNLEELAADNGCSLVIKKNGCRNTAF